MSIIKGVVLEKSENFAIVLTADGQFRKIVKGKFEVGDEVLGKEFKPRKSLYQRLVGGVAIAAALLLAFLMPGVLNEDKSSNTIIASSDKSESTVVAYVKVDINPSLKLGLNEDLKVIEAIPLNADGEQVLAQGDLTEMSVSSAMELVAERCYKLGYIKEDKENIVNLTYIPQEKSSSKIDKDKLERDIKVKVEKVMDKKKIKGEVKELKVDKRNNITKESNKKNPVNPQYDRETEIENSSSNSKKTEVNNNGKEKTGKEAKTNDSKVNSDLNSNSSSNSNNKDKDKEDNEDKTNKDKSNKEDKSDRSNDNGPLKNIKKNTNQSNDNSKDKIKGNSSNNEVGRVPWYKIFELG